MKKILVVDDDFEIRAVVEKILKKNNFVVEAISRWQYLSYSIQYFKPDLILLDVSLEGADGRDMCNQLKRSKPTSHIPVVLFSAYPNLLQNLKECKPDAVITKPFDNSSLVDTIRQSLSNN